MIKKDLSDLRKTITWLGFDSSTGKWGVFPPIYGLVTFSLFMNSIYEIQEQEDVAKKLDGFKGLVMYVMGLMYLSALSFNWHDQMVLVETIGRGLYRCSHRISADRLDLELRIQKDINTQNAVWYYAMNGYSLLVVVAPLSILIIRALEKGVSNLTVEMLYLSIPFYYPKNRETITTFVIAFICQSFFFVYCLRHAYILLVSSFNSMQILEGELKLLKQSLVEMENLIRLDRRNIKNNQTDIIFEDVPNSNIIDKKNLKMFFTFFLEHHRIIYRKVQDVTKGIQVIAVIINSVMSILLCSAIYRIATMDDLFVVLQEAIYGTILTSCLYCYGLMGEKVLSADENLRKALYEYPWIDKPAWFKKSLQIIMTRSNKPVEIKSRGLFSLNLRNFVGTLQAAYSYYNILTHLK